MHKMIVQDHCLGSVETVLVGRAGALKGKWKRVAKVFAYENENPDPQSDLGLCWAMGLVHSFGGQLNQT
jgi:hypothetical protein